MGKSAKKSFKLVEMGMVQMPEARRLFVEMTVEENFDMGSLAKLQIRCSHKTQIDELLSV